MLINYINLKLPTPPLPPEPSEAEMELYRRQQFRLHELHEAERRKREFSEEADQIRGQIHRKYLEWSQGKNLYQMLITLDQVRSLSSFDQIQSLVLASPDPETVRAAYRFG